MGLTLGTPVVRTALLQPNLKEGFMATMKVTVYKYSDGVILHRGKFSVRIWADHVYDEASKTKTKTAQQCVNYGIDRYAAADDDIEVIDKSRYSMF
jgi:hypothetical protein